VRFDDAGDPEEVVRPRDGGLEVRTRELFEFAALKNTVVCVYFDFVRWSAKSLAELGFPETADEIRRERVRFDLVIREPRLGDEEKVVSRLLGKKLLLPMARSRTRFAGWREEKYEKFTIATDPKEKPTVHTCDPDKLADFFGKNPDAPSFLTPVFFGREVLTKYFNEPSKYKVEDGRIRCGTLWSLRIDNNHEKYVVVYLGYLGGLPHKDQLHWKEHEVPPDGSPSDVSLRRGLLAIPAPPSAPDLRFKYLLATFSREWSESLRWHLFRPLRPDDEHHLGSLRIPLTEEQAEFDAQVQSLVKLFVDSLNEDAIIRILGSKRQSERGISKLERLLEAVEAEDYTEHIVFLRDLYDLRGGAAHRKGQAYDRATLVFQVKELGRRRAFEGVLVHAGEFLVYLRDLLKNPDIVAKLRAPPK
ncbi:MAG: hypothetical protein L0216_11030, partial [Planctomycetales bacterium]|nr:hypothetical protein [Planctomycetales bacterium]